MAKESLSLLFFLLATAIQVGDSCRTVLKTCALQCRDYVIVSCGEHDAKQDTICSTWEKLSSGDKTMNKTCGQEWNKCGSGEISYSFADFKLNLEFATCAKGDEGETDCLDDVEELSEYLASDVASLQNQFQPAVTFDSSKICLCDGDLCNSALLNVCQISVLLFGVFLPLFL